MGVFSLFGRVFRGIPREVIAMAIAARDPATPRAARLLALAAGLYALSPIDLVPDVLVGLGWLDDLLVVPTVMALAARFVPLDVMARAPARRCHCPPAAPLADVGAVRADLAGGAAGAGRVGAQRAVALMP